MKILFFSFPSENLRKTLENIPYYSIVGGIYPGNILGIHFKLRLKLGSYALHTVIARFRVPWVIKYKFSGRSFLNPMVLN